MEDIDNGVASAIDTGGVGQQSNAFTSKGLEAAHGEHFVAEVNTRFG